MLSVETVELVTVRRCRECGSAEHGQPVIELASGTPAGCFVSFARADGTEVAAARLRGPVGIDIESRTAVAAHAVAEALLHPAEAGALAELAPAEVAERLATLWVVKEALLKATGHGLRVDLREIEVVVGADTTTIRRWPAELDLREAPHIVLFAPTDGLVGAIAEL